MNDYFEVRFDLNPSNEIMTDLLAAVLVERGFDSFVPDSNGLNAYIAKEVFDESLLELDSFDWPFDSKISVSYKLIPGQDWNAEWERNYFKPIVIKDKCVIHSSFHTDYPQAPYDIVIDPKMAFGTGHHATTSLIVSQLLEIQLENKKVLDMGTGTGILAILAYKRGARPVVAVEIDPVAYENTIENVSLNGCEGIDVRLGDVKAIENESDVDIFIANINRNVILEDLQSYAGTMNRGARIILSGFLRSDFEIMEKNLLNLGFKEIALLAEGDWISISAILD